MQPSGAIRLGDIELAAGSTLALLLQPPSANQGLSQAARRDAVRAALRSILSQVTGESAVSLRFGKTKEGKPFMLGREPVAFNVSHCAGRSLIALSRSALVGCDIEDRFTELDADELSPLILHEAEAQAIGALPLRDRRDAFMRYWVRKEAVLKAAGSGFLDDPRSIIVGLQDHRPRWSLPAPLPRYIHNRDIAAGCLGAVASDDAACCWFEFAA